MLQKINKGLDLPISGAPEQVIFDSPPVTSVGVLGIDFIGLKPQMAIQVGEQVKLGQTLFTNKIYPTIRYTAPGCGVVTAINRGNKRTLLSVIIKLDGNDEETFPVYSPEKLNQLTHEQVQQNLLASGLWTALRTRPYSKIPNPDTIPRSVFVTAIDTNPLALQPKIVLAEQMSAFGDGLKILSKLTAGKLFVCTAPQTQVPIANIPNLTIVEFAGPHPAGLPGTHIHFLDPINANKFAWHIGYQDVIAIGKLFTTGRLSTERIIALAGPAVKQPRLLRTRLGANVATLTAGEVTNGIEVRVISGSILSGHNAMAEWAQYLGRYHTQISVIREERERRFLGWISPGSDRYSHHNVLISSLFQPQHKFAFTTAQQGSPRAFIPIDSFSRVMPLDILPTMLLRALMVGDTERAQELGCLELDEEDLALCTYVCPSKYQYGAALRATLNQIEKES